MNNAFGDFQTPPDLVDGVLQTLTSLGRKFARVIEPTCGVGAFIDGLLRLPSPPLEIRGFELQEHYVSQARQLSTSSRAKVVVAHADFFQVDLRRELRWDTLGPLLVVGNPPWVTNSNLSAIGSDNRPKRENLKNLRGIDALTGESNFDIAEYVWLKLIRELAHEKPSIALLCKTSVARNVLRYAAANDIPLCNCFIRRVDVKKWFDAAADACLFYVEVGTGETDYRVADYCDLRSSRPDRVMGFAGTQLVADMVDYEQTRFADGVSPITWRQGLKHDAADVMELTCKSGEYLNKAGGCVGVESEYLYPLLKSSDVFKGEQQQPRLLVIVPQRRLGEDTSDLEHRAPQLWRYLVNHAAILDNRKSGIYRSQPRFAIFGIGDYSFAPFKVGVSGLYKKPRFRAIGPINGRPVMLDDTCYFTPCNNARQTAVLTALLNDPLCLKLIDSLLFDDSKRPVTKKLLQRIDLVAALQRIDRAQLLDRASTELKQLGGTDFDWPLDLTGFFQDTGPVGHEDRQGNLPWVSA